MWTTPSRQESCCDQLRPPLPGSQKINFSTVVAGQAIGIEEVHDDIWLVSFMDYDLGYFGVKALALEPLKNTFGPKQLPMRPVRSLTHLAGLDPKKVARPRERF
jgi:hypothetical protein